MSSLSLSFFILSLLSKLTNQMPSNYKLSRGHIIKWDSSCLLKWICFQYKNPRIQPINLNVLAFIMVNFRNNLVPICSVVLWYTLKLRVSTLAMCPAYSFVRMCVCAQKYASSFPSCRISLNQIYTPLKSHQHASLPYKHSHQIIFINTHTHTQIHFC